MNTTLLMRVVDRIRETPDCYDQGSWITSGEPGCGAAACVAGWTYILSRAADDPPPVALAGREMNARARDALEIPHHRARLLFAAEWPLDWWRRAGITRAGTAAGGAPAGGGRRNRSFPTIEPRADEAVAILSAMAAAGEVWGPFTVAAAPASTAA